MGLRVGLGAKWPRMAESYWTALRLAKSLIFLIRFFAFAARVWRIPWLCAPVYDFLRGKRTPGL